MTEFKKQTYSDQVQDFIKECILSGELKPGDQVKEVAIAARLSISRAPVREAMEKLAREGLIDSRPQKGKYITALTSKQIRNSYFTGGVLEAAAVAQCIDSYTEEDFKRLDDLVSDMQAVAEKGGAVSEMAPMDSEFHSILFSRVDNELLVELCRRSCQGISKFLLFKHWIKLFPAKKVHKRHADLLVALKSRKPSRIEKIIREHYVTSGERMAQFGVDVYED